MPVTLTSPFQITNSNLFEVSKALTQSRLSYSKELTFSAFLDKNLDILEAIGGGERDEQLDSSEVGDGRMLASVGFVEQIHERWECIYFLLECETD